MKYIGISLIFFSFLLACSTNRQVVQLPSEKIITTPVVTTQTQKPVVQIKKIKEKPYIIDDFETGLFRWEKKSTLLSKVAMMECKNERLDGHAVKVEYELPSKRQRTIEPDEIIVSIVKHHNFESYKGLTFYAKAEGNFHIKISLYEKNTWDASLQPIEIWYRMVKVTKKWRKYKVYFRKFNSEEYYEQDFIGDEILNLDKIKKVSFSIDNSKDIDSVNGSFSLDEIYLF